MRAGLLRHRIVIQQKGTIIRDSFGEPTPAWPILATVWAAVDPLRGREFAEQRQAGAEVTTRIRIRYRSDV